jgi:hypothetical protein
MKIALCLSGHIRSLFSNIENLKKFVVKDNECDIFLHVWDTYGWRAQGNDISLENNGFKGFDQYSDSVDQEKVLELLKPRKYVFENYLEHEKTFHERAKRYTRVRVPHLDRPIQIVSMAYKIAKCNELKTAQEIENGLRYDVVIRSRPDMVHFADLFEGNISEFARHDFLVTPNEYCHNGATDIFAFGNSVIMDRYATLYDKLDEIYDDGVLFNPHDVSQHFFDKYFRDKWVKTNLHVDLNRCRKGCDLPKGCEIYGSVFNCDLCDPRKKVLTVIQ